MQKNIYDILVSIIIPVYNVEEYLEDCLKSVVEQTFLDKEVILIDDGSTDSSCIICDNYSKKYSYIRTIHKENGGLSSARNRGIGEAQGEWIIFLDSDDYWIDSRALEHLINVAKKTKADVVRGEYKEVDENGKDLFSPNINREQLSLEGKCLNNKTFARKILSRGHFSWLLLIKKSQLGDIKFNEEQKFQEDIDFNIRFFSVPRNCVYTTFKFYAYRKRANSIMSTPKIENLKFSFLLSDTWHFFADKICNDKGLRSFYIYNSIMMYHWTLETLASDIYFNNRSSIIKDFALEERQKMVLGWARNDAQYYPFSVYITPIISVRILRYVTKAKGYIFTIGSRCKTFIKRIISYF